MTPLPELADRGVLLEAPDTPAAAACVDQLRGAGFQVQTCRGRGPDGGRCPLLRGFGCRLLDEAGWVVNALPAGDREISLAVVQARGAEHVARLSPGAGPVAGLEAVRRMRSRRGRAIRRLFHTGDGAPLLVRAVEARDAARFKRFDDGLCDRTRRLRYLSYMPLLSPELVARMTEVDFGNRMAFVALAGRREMRCVVADARLFRDPDPPYEAELAIAVADDLQAHGLGSYLVDLLLTLAAEGGFGVRADVRFDNDRMLRILRRAGFQRESTELGIVAYRWRPARQAGLAL